MTQESEGGRRARPLLSRSLDSFAAPRALMASAIPIAAIAVVLAVVAFGGRQPRPGAPRLVAHAGVPPQGRLLWVDGRATVAGVREVAAMDSTGRVFLVDDRLEVREAAVPGDVASIVSAAPNESDGGIWLVDGRGRLVRVAPDGGTVAEVPSPYIVASLGGSAAGGLIVLTRSVEGFPFVLDTAPEAPVVAVDGRPRGAAVRRRGPPGAGAAERSRERRARPPRPRRNRVRAVHPGRGGRVRTARGHLVDPGTWPGTGDAGAALPAGRAWGWDPMAGCTSSARRIRP